MNFDGCRWSTGRETRDETRRREGRDGVRESKNNNDWTPGPSGHPLFPHTRVPRILCSTSYFIRMISTFSFSRVLSTKFISIFYLKKVVSIKEGNRGSGGASLEEGRESKTSRSPSLLVSKPKVSQWHISLRSYYAYLTGSHLFDPLSSLLIGTMVEVLRFLIGDEVPCKREVGWTENSVEELKKGKYGLKLL